MATPSDLHVIRAIEHWYRTMPGITHEWVIDSNQAWPSLSTKRYIQQFVKREVNNAEVLADALIAKDITLWEWELFMVEHIRITHILAGLVGGMGLNQWDNSIKQMVKDNIIFQLHHLSNFSGGISKGKLSDNMVTARAMMYPMSGNLGYERIRRRTAILNGATHERRLMAVKEACSDCLAASSAGWKKIGTLPEIGASRCIVRCLCQFDFRRKISLVDKG